MDMKMETLACFNLNDEQRSRSSSGAIYPLIAEYMLENGGAVFAAVYNDELDVIHKRLYSKEDIDKSCGSKYVTSMLGNTFKSILHELKKGVPCLFTGTPCQCSGLISYVSAMSGIQDPSLLENLFCVDFVCHGVPGRVAWHKYLSMVRKCGFNVKSVFMRDKSTGWSKQKYSFSLIDANGNKMTGNWGDNCYMRGFVSNLYLRPSCYNCRFKGIDRGTDITLADYWGVWDLQSEMDDNKGTSLVFVHSIKGKKLLEKLADRMKSMTVDNTKYLDYNRSIIDPSKYNNKSDKFYNQVNRNKSFKKVVDDLTGYSFIGKIKRKLGVFIN